MTSLGTEAKLSVLWFLRSAFQLLLQHLAFSTCWDRVFFYGILATMGSWVPGCSISGLILLGDVHLEWCRIQAG